MAASAPTSLHAAIQAHRASARRDRAAARRAATREGAHRLHLSARRHDAAADELAQRLRRAPVRMTSEFSGPPTGLSAVRTRWLRRQIAASEATAQRNENTARRHPIAAVRVQMLKVAATHRAKANEMRAELARFTGSSAPRSDVAEVRRQRRIEALRSAVARETELARLARTVGNRSVEGAHLAEARRYRTELTGIEQRMAPVTTGEPVAVAQRPATAFYREKPPSHLSPAGRVKLARLDREIDLYLKKAAALRNRAGRAAAVGATADAAKALEGAQIIEARARTSMGARRKLLYVQGRPFMPAGERPLRALTDRAARGIADKSLITSPAIPSPGASYTRPRPGFEAPRVDTESRLTTVSAKTAPPSDALPTVAADEGTPSAADEASATQTPSEGGGSNLTLWLIGGVLLVGGVFAYTKSKGKAGAARSFSLARPGSTPAAKQNPKRNRRRRR